MNARPALWAAALFGLLFATASVAGDIVVSQSNAPHVRLGDRVQAMLGAERVSLSALPQEKARRLVTQPVRAKLWSKKPAEVAVKYDVSYLRAMPVVEGGKAWTCLTEALYFEARGESVEGIFAVGEVILNRVDSEVYPDDVCGVVHQGTGELFRCQFTYTCDGRKEVIAEPRAWRKVGKVARLLLDGTAPRDLTEQATHYHTKSVQPRWSRVFTRTATIGYHHFYRQEPRYASN